MEGRRQPNRELRTQGMTQFELSDFFFLTHLSHIGSGEASFSIMPVGTFGKNPKKSMLSLAKTLRERLHSKTEMLDNNCPSPTMHSRRSCGQPSLHHQNWSGESGCVTRCPKSPVFKKKIKNFIYLFMYFWLCWVFIVAQVFLSLQ